MFFPRPVTAWRMARQACRQQELPRSAFIAAGFAAAGCAVKASEVWKPARCETDPGPVAAAFFSGVVVGGVGVGYVLRDAAAQEVKTAQKATLESLLGEGAAQALEKITDVANKTGMMLLPMACTHHPLLLNLGMLCKQIDEEQRYATPPTSGQPYEDKDVMTRAARFSKFATAAYYDKKGDIAACIPDLAETDIVFVHNTNSVASPNFFIADDHVTDSIVLSIRGTASVADALTDMVCEKVPFLGGEAHAGFMANAEEVSKHAVPVLKELVKASPMKKVVVVGHSLGAGTAILTTLKLFSDSGMLMSAVFSASKSLSCFAFAPPSTFAPLEKLPLFANSCIYSFVYGWDVIPRACLGTTAKLLSAIKEIDELPMTPMQRLSYVASSRTKLDFELPDSRALDKTLPAETMHTFSSTYGVGTMILMYRGHDGSICCDKIDATLTDKILLHPDMVKCHSVVGYVNALDEVMYKLTK
mmetsp:Transcript_68989/g.122016  ORF Transcript_68989/g.122016 Transcript_68989/m.122016 type:complete len:474 (-) Transcript_68989:53-1474(-)